MWRLDRTREDQGQAAPPTPHRPTLGRRGRVASSAFSQDNEEPRAKRIRQGHGQARDADMSELVEYELEDHKEAAKVCMPILRQEGVPHANGEGTSRQGL